VSLITFSGSRDPTFRSDASFLSPFCPSAASSTSSPSQHHLSHPSLISTNLYPSPARRTTSELLQVGSLRSAGLQTDTLSPSDGNEDGESGAREGSCSDGESCMERTRSYWRRRTRSCEESRGEDCCGREEGWS